MHRIAFPVVSEWYQKATGDESRSLSNALFPNSYRSRSARAHHTEDVKLPREHHLKHDLTSL